jgi:hypothetical protein
MGLFDFLKKAGSRENIDKKKLAREELEKMTFTEQANIGRDKGYDDETRIMAMKMRWDVPMLNEVMNDRANSKKVREVAKTTLGMVQMMAQTMFGGRR